MIKILQIWAFLLLSSLSLAESKDSQIPGPEEATFTVYLKLPGGDYPSKVAGRPGPGFEIFDITPHWSYATVVIIPKTGEPFRKRYENVRCPNIWERLQSIDLLKYNDSDFGDENSINELWKSPFEEFRTSLLISDNSTGRSLIIHDPITCIDALKDTPEGEALKEFWDLYFFTIGYYTMIDE